MASVSEPLDEGGGDSIKIYVRVRPSMESDNCLLVKSPTDIVLRSHANPREFRFDHIADQNTTQESVFCDVGKQVVESCVEGYNGTIFAYGQTGSGKTYTMLGPGEESEGNFNNRFRGIIPRSLDYLFELLQRKKEMYGNHFEFSCMVSFMEIYNEQVFDLLDSASGVLHVRESKQRGVFVEGAVERIVANGMEAYSVLTEGWCNRRVASTSMNRESSRSHALFTVAIEQKEHEHMGGITKIRQSLLHLVDLAGSEKQKDSQASGQQLREAGKINGSLSVLGQVIMALNDLAHKKERHVPYRNSKLTFLLRDSLGGNAKTFIIVNVHPNSRFVGETLSTLQFAKRAKLIKNRARVNENMQGDVTELQREIKRLKEVIRRYKVQRSQGRVAASSEHGLDMSMKESLEYKTKFYTAMQMLERREKIIESFRTQISKMEKYMMSRDLILKLRNSEIHSFKHSTVVSQDQRYVALEQEIKALKEQITHHPKVALYGIKISELQHEIDRLEGRRMFVERTEKELGTLYATLTKNRKDSVFVSEKEPNSSGNEQNDARVTELEARHAAQEQEMKKLREENTNLKTELKLSNERKDELKQMIDAMREGRKRLQSMHENTLRIITTPRRSRGTPNSAQGPTPRKRPRVGLIPMDSLDNDDVSIVPSLMDEPEPEEMEDAVQEALQDELKKAKEDAEQFRDENLVKSNEIFELRKSEAALQDKLRLFEKNLLQEKKRASVLETQNAKQKGDSEILRIEVRDLKILLTSADKELKEIKEKYKSMQTALNEKIEVLEEKTHKLEASCFTLEQEKEKLLQENQSLGVEVEDLQLEVGFIKEQLEESGKSSEKERMKIKNLEEKLEEAEEQVVREKESCNMLREQLEGENKTTSEALVALQTSNHDLKQELSAAYEQCVTSDGKIGKLESEMASLKKEKEDDKKSIQALFNQVSELRGTNSMLEIANSGLHADLDEIKEKLARSSSDFEKERKDREAAEVNLAVKTEEFNQKEAKQQFDMEMIQEDLIYWNSQNMVQLAALKEKEEKMGNLEQEVASLRKELEEKSEKLKEQAGLISRAEQNEVSLRQNMEENVEKYVKKLQEESVKSQKVTDEFFCKFMDANSRVVDLENDLKMSNKDKLLIEAEYKKKMIEMEKKYEKLVLEEREMLETKLKETTNKQEEMQENSAAMQMQYSQTLSELKNLQLELGEKTADCIRYKELEEKHYTQLQELRTKYEEVSTVKSHAEEKLKAVMEEKENLMSEMSKVVGHRNKNQRIHYVQKLSEKCRELEQELQRKVNIIHSLATSLKKYEPNYALPSSASSSFLRALSPRNAR